MISASGSASFGTLSATRCVLLSLGTASAVAVQLLVFPRPAAGIAA
jgi:hypothetical protein